MRLPNGYGSVHKLSGNRRNPWRARKTDGWEIIDGKLKQKYINIGCYKTQAEALAALSEFNKNPNIIPSNVTFAEVYQQWSSTKFEKISNSNINGYKAAYKLCSKIYDTPFAELRLQHLQNVVNQANKNPPTLKKLRILLNQLFDYAVMHEIISKEKHLVKYIDIGKSEKSSKHYRFSDGEVKTIWSWSENNEYVQVILMLIYSGVRPGELFNLKKEHVNIDEKYFIVVKGKNDNAERKVPIHDKTLPFFTHWMQKEGSEYLVTQMNGNKIKFDTHHQQFTETYWVPVLSEMGILEYTNDKGETKEHTPDDTRHTFTTMWREKKLDEAMRRKIQGHSGKGIGEIVYTHLEFEKLRKELNKLK